MEYEVVSANNPDAIARRLNGKQGWEVITITCETSYGVPCYSAFIRRTLSREGTLTESILEVFDRRIRSNPAGLVVYEHEVSNFVAALRGTTRDTENTVNLEDVIRSGHFRYRGLPVRVD